ncbi:MAG TPA: DNA polymerase III subunit gamma and tau [Nocardioidaceae bacterium]|nr:DNA polymerase III subunit gamma and tau [Nocardioidaceae bacterium]
MDAPLALYRRYRPETFAEVIGQEHVTTPLRAALKNNRVHHAYLFSGPRGCGKTTSARILARALNCEQGPTDEPCGECQSCQDLARGGPGSIDVIEIDAASHGGVDDARDLRERAFFAPVNSRYKVYIIDEAHMVSSQGFNALLKLVEEPPPHLKFVFATTEPEKVIGTIRSRTHHYPFRLIPPKVLSAYLSEICEREGVAIEPAALPLVVRAGGGSARDTLSVLDQLIGGAGPDGVTYALATGLLGFTPETLLDEVVDGFAAGDGSAVFGVVDKVIETGQDPRRFTEDLLRRLRDLVIISAVPDAPASGLIDVPEDQAERLVAQAARFGRADLTRAAELVADGLTDLKGATAPRLLLELICARVLLPGADDRTDGVMARLDRIEKRMAIEGTPSAAAGGPPQRAASRSPQASTPSPPRPAPQPPSPTKPAPEPPTPPVEPSPGPPDPTPAPQREPPVQPAPAGAPAAEPAPAEPAPAEPALGGSGLGLVELRRLWPDVVEAVKHMRRVTWIHLSQHAQVVSVDDNTLTLGFKNAGARDSFVSGGSHEILRQAAIDVVGRDWRIEAIVDPSAQPGTEPPMRTTRPAVRPEDDAPPPAPEPPPAAPPASRADPAAVATARGAIRETRASGPATDRAPADSDEHVDRDDPDADDTGLDGAQLLARELGARVIEEIRHD